MMSLLDMFSGPIGQRLSLTLLHFVWQGLAVAVTLKAALWFFPPRRARTRYALCLIGLLTLVACPVISFGVLQVRKPAEAVVATDQPLRALNVAGAPMAPAEFAAGLSVLSQGTPGDPTLGEPTGPPGRQHWSEISTSDRPAALPATPPWRARLTRWARGMQPYLVIVWMGGVVLMGARLLVSFVGVRQLARDRRAVSAELALLVAELAARFGLGRAPPLFRSERIREAIVVGVLRPMILLPGSWLTEMTPEVLEAVLAHELGHIRRWDTWINLMQRVAETLLFYHPVVWWLSRRLSLEREMCTDELAVAATGERMTYAATLELLGRKRLSLAAVELGAAMGGSKMALLGRVRNILGVTPSRERARWWPVAVLALLLPMAMVFAGTAALLTGAETGKTETASAATAGTDARTMANSAEDPMKLGPGDCTLAGQVLDDRGAPVAGAYVVVYDHRSGIPLVQGTFQLFTECLGSPDRPRDLAHAITDDQGQFCFQKMPAGEYRLVAQSWSGARPAKDLLHLTSPVVHLRGVADHVRLSPEASSDVVLRPLGTGVLVVDDNTGEYLDYYGDYENIEEVLRKQAFLMVISTAPLRGDAILGFPAWGGPFLQAAIGATRKLPGKVVVDGLPNGKVHVALGFWSDEDSGFATAEADIRPQTTTRLRIPVMARWAKDRFLPPHRLKPLAQAVDFYSRKLSDGEPRPYAYLQMVMNTSGISFGPQKGDYVLHYLRGITRYMDREVRLPQGGKATFGDVMSACQYIELARQQQQRAELPPVTHFEGSVELEKEIPVEFRLGKAQGSFAMEGQWIRFVRIGGQMHATLRAKFTPVMDGRWRVELALMDDEGRVAAKTEAAFDLTRMTEGPARGTEHYLPFALPRKADLSAAKRFRISLSAFAKGTD